MTQKAVETISQCENCGSALHGEYCASCGQSIYGPNRFFLTLMHEAFENIFQLDSRALRTLRQILFVPGKVAKEYLAGKRLSYVHPVRFYIVTSIMYFLFLSVSNFFAPSVGGNLINIDDDAALEQLQEQIVSAQVQSGEEGEAASEDTKVALEKLRKEIAKAREAQDESGIENVFGDDSIDLNIPGLTGEREKQWEAYLLDQREKVKSTLREDPRELVEQFLEAAPVLMFLTLPLVALLLKLIFLLHRFYYTEHLVFVVYNHCFLFLLLLSIELVEFIGVSLIVEPLQSIMILWAFIYLFLSLKRVYELSFFKAVLASFPLFFGHLVILLFAALTVLIVGLVTL